MSDAPITLEAADSPVAHIRLNRPAKKNAATLELLEALTETAEALHTRPNLRAVILSGAGGDFCAGLDTSLFMKFAADIEGVKRLMLDLPEGATANPFQRPAQTLHALPVPVIAAIEGVCFGAGMQIALAADYRIAAPDARLSIMETNWGLIPDMGLCLSLPRLMPSDRAMRLIMTAEVLSGLEAEQAGLVSETSDSPLEAATALAGQVAERSPDAIRAAKALIDGLWPSSGADGLALEARLQAEIIGQPNQIEAVMAGMQKRPAKFS